MDNKFTPGPWIAGCMSHSDYKNYYVDDQFGLVICEVGGRVIKEEIAEANAHLIAAAPEMYEALRNWHDMFEWGGFAIDFSNGITHQGCDKGDIKGNNMLSEFIQSTKAALQKARGEHG